MSNISIFGLGYVGCVGMGCLAAHGHRMVGVDKQVEKVDFIDAGKPTIIENHIEEVLREAHAAGLVSATTDSAQAIQATDVSFICVGTPSTANGHLNLTGIHKVAEEIGHGLAQKSTRHVVAIRSTVLPGTNEAVTAIIAEASGKTPDVDFAVVSNPEFLREGTSVADFNHPPLTLLGTSCDWAVEVMREVYAKIDAPFEVTEPRNAELMKYVCNSFHALKITFANEVGNICRKLDVDGTRLMELFCLDRKLNISPAYLKPGFAYGGSCLPKDLKALRTIAHDHYLESPVLESIERSNEMQKELVCREIIACGIQEIGILGLSFKAGTDDLRESPIVDVLERLLGKGFNVKIYDRHVHLSRLQGANREFILQRIPFISRFITDDLAGVIDHAKLLVVVNQEPEVQAALEMAGVGKRIFNLATQEISD